MTDITLYIKRPFHIPDFKIYSTDRRLLASLCLQYGKYIADSPIAETFDIDITQPADNNYIVKYNKNQIITQNPLFELDNIFFHNTIYDESIIALHGSAVEWRGKAYLFLAATTSGKTTLASYLTSSGFGYITDDCILLDRDSFQVYPYSCPIQLRDGGLKVLRKLEKAPDNLQFLDDVMMRRYIYTPVNCVVQPLPLGGVNFIERSETENMICGMTSNGKMAQLMKSPITHYETTPEYLRLLAKLAAFRCERLIYCDMDFVAETLRKAGEAVG